MVRFVTTAYTHMYENEYVGLPEERVRKKGQNELTEFGIRTNRWREHANLTVEETVRLVSKRLAKTGEGFSSKDYWGFVRGQIRLTSNQIRALAHILGTTPYDLTHRTPNEVPEKEEPKPEPQTIEVHRPRKKKVPKVESLEVAPRKSIGEERPYDSDEAARLLAKRFGDRVKRDKRSR